GTLNPLQSQPDQPGASGPQDQPDDRDRRVGERLEPAGPGIVAEDEQPQDADGRDGREEDDGERGRGAAESGEQQRHPAFHRVKLSPLSALSSSSCEKLKSGFVRSSWRLRPSTICSRPSVSAQNIGPPR